MADPFVLRVNNRYYAYGTGDKQPDGRAFPLLVSEDLVQWRSLGGALKQLSDENLHYWAPEVAHHQDKFFMYYSAGGSDGKGHQLRVAVADKPEGPFQDAGKILMPDEPFSIDAHPFHDPVSGRWYLFFAKDFFDGRAGTGIAVVRLNDDMMSVEGPITTAVRASADWQIFERNRQWYDKTWDAWHTVEGPTVLYHHGRYYCLYSGGRWEAANYGLGYAVADSISGPYKDEYDAEGPCVLAGVPDKVCGPGHNSITVSPDFKTHLVVYHAWDPGYKARTMRIDPLIWTDKGPKCDGPSHEPRTLNLAK